uniref:Uncharacterized protein n=1 Tax=Rhizophora mucronata TaxID=61149 RepID=A0A2P2P3Q4_RHIMU
MTRLSLSLLKHRLTLATAIRSHTHTLMMQYITMMLLYTKIRISSRNCSKLMSFTII